MKMKNFGALLGFDGKSKGLAQNVIHFKINDMQVAEDLILIVMHIIMQKLSKISLK